MGKLWSVFFYPSSHLSRKSWEILFRGNRMKWALRIALKEKGWNDVRGSLDGQLLLASQTLALCCAGCVHIHYRSSLRPSGSAASRSLVPAKNSDFLSSPKSSSRHDWFNCWTICPVLCWGCVLFWLCLQVPVYPVLGSGILLQHLAKRRATRFVELDLQWPWSTALHRFAFFLFVWLSSSWHWKEPSRPLQSHRQTKIF